MVGAAGTDLAEVRKHVDDAFRDVSYITSHIRLSELLLRCSRNASLTKGPAPTEDRRLAALMDAGDALRRAAKRGDAVVLLGLMEIERLRVASMEEHGGQVPGRRVNVIHSLKHPKEIEALRDVYGAAFVSVAVYTPRAKRVDALTRRIAASRSAYTDEEFRQTATKLIDRDEQEAGVDDLGQNVRETFPQCDVFLDATDKDSLAHQVRRFIQILFRHPHRTPTKAENALFHAQAAALRSADLSRQVGAVITHESGELIATGCNEVPKAGGDAVWEGDGGGGEEDRRDFVVGHDSSARMKYELLIEVFDRLRGAGWLAPDKAALLPDMLVADALYAGEPILKGTRAASIIEFGRIVHAEMSAITSAARLGLSVKGSTLYCTTFPCHMCARHIVAAGVKRVVYVEPYPKSMARELYKGAISVDHDPDAHKSAVIFEPFVGVSPRRYIDFFEMPVRKDKRGHAVEWKRETALPRVVQYHTYRDIEAQFINVIRQNAVGWGIASADPSGRE